MNFPASGAANWIRWNCRCTIGSKRLELMNHAESWWSFKYMDTWIIRDQMWSCCHTPPGYTSQGAATRMVGKTVFNPRSSRSHAVVMHGCSNAFENLCLRWRSDLRSLKLVRWSPDQRPWKTHVCFFFHVWFSWIFYDFDPERPWALRLHICWSQEASGVHQMLRMKALIDLISIEIMASPAYCRVATEICAAILWPSFSIDLLIFQKPSRWSSSLSTLGTIVKHPGAIPFSDAASRNEESYGSRLRHLPSCTRETRVYLVDLAGIIMWFKVSKKKHTFFSFKGVFWEDADVVRILYEGIEAHHSCALQEASELACTP